MTTEEGTFKTRDGTSLYTKTWKPSTPSNLHLIFIHGFSDHVNAYYNLFPTLSSHPYNITIHGFDQRGWGRSVPATSKAARGQTGDTALVLSDIHDFIIHVSQQIQTTSTTSSLAAKLFLMGHSMGGAEVLYYTLSTTPLHPSLPVPLSGLLLESPHISFTPTNTPSPLLVISGRIAAKLLPNMHMLQKLDSSAMSRNPQVCRDWDNDALCHDTGTLRGLAGLLDRAGHLDALGHGKKVAGLQGKLSIPVFWAHGTEDRVVDFGASKRLFETVGKGTEGSELKAYEGGYHKIHGEPDGMGEEFANDVGRWIVGIAGEKSGKIGGEAEVSAKREVVPEQEVTAQKQQQYEQQEMTMSTGDHGVVSEDQTNVKSRL